MQWRLVRYILRKFADDTKIGHMVTTEDEKEELQQAQNNLTNWAKRWGREFNIKKCKVMRVGHNNQNRIIAWLEYSWTLQTRRETSE